MNTSDYSVFSVDQRNVWRVFKYHSAIANTISSSLLLYWICLSIYLYYVLVSTDYTSSYASSYYYLTFFTVIVAYPVIYFVNQLLVTNTTGEDGGLPNLDPYYGICMQGPNSLTDKEMGMGVVGKIDYKCMKEQFDYNSTAFEMITSRAYSVVYAIFTLVLFLFTSSAGKFQDQLATRNSTFVRACVQHALFLALILVSGSLLKNYYYVSSFPLFFFSGLLQILGALVVMLMCYILYRLIFLYR